MTVTVLENEPDFTYVLGQPKKSEKDDENPFSFKKFLQTGSGGARPKNRSGDPSLATLDLACDLPDFVQPVAETNRRPTRGSSDVPLPDFALDSNGSLPMPNSHSSLSNDVDLSATNASSSDNRSHVRTLDLPGDSFVPLQQELDLSPRPAGLPDPIVSLGDQSPDDVPHSTGGLPDFLSDSALSTTANTQSNSPPTVRHSSLGDIAEGVVLTNGDHRLEIHRVSVM